jgi:hypothetical protein
VEWSYDHAVWKHFVQHSSDLDKGNHEAVAHVAMNPRDIFQPDFFGFQVVTAQRTIRIPNDGLIVTRVCRPLRIKPIRAVIAYAKEV